MNYDTDCGSLKRPPEAAKYLRERYGFGAPRTLAKLRSIGGGPAFRKIGNKLIVYEDSALDAWALSKLSAPYRSTSEVAASAA